MSENIHKYYDQLTTKEKDFVDEAIDEVLVLASFKQVNLPNDDNIERVADTLSKYVIKERKEPLEIEKYLVVSTAHVTEEDMKKLREPNSKLSSYEFPYGRAMYTGDDGIAYLLANLAKTMGYSKGMQDMIKLAYQSGCVFLKLDQDGPIVEGYKTYEW